MNRQIISKIIGISCLLGLSVAVASVTKEHQSAGDTGTIVTVNPQSHTIQIGDKKLILSDRLKIYSDTHEILNPLYLDQGQKIEYWLNPDSKDHELYKIRILTGYNQSSELKK